MDVTPLLPEGGQVIHGYGDGGFRIAQIRYNGPVLVMPRLTLPWAVDPAAALAPLDLAGLEPILAAEEVFDILLLGPGDGQGFVPPGIRRALRKRGQVAAREAHGRARPEG